MRARVCLRAHLVRDVPPAREERVGVAHRQLVDVHHMTMDDPVVGPLAERGQGAGDDVHETPDELAEHRALALARHLPATREATSVTRRKSPTPL